MTRFIAELIELILDLLLWVLKLAIAVGPYLFLLILVITATSGA